MPINAYRVNERNSFEDVFGYIQSDLETSPTVDVGEWQSIHRPTFMRELRNVSLSMPLDQSPEMLAARTGAHLPWAEDHFLERVSGMPQNPSPSEAWWPFAQKKNNASNGEHKSEGEAFSHTYPERMWPKFANEGHRRPNGRDVFVPHNGIRFEYGDLDDIVNQLFKSPNTRQAYLPIWFPEDTGAVHAKRVPCTLGYHFAIREGVLDITYYMRSTDLLRHFQDDIYLAGRLAQWMVAQLNNEAEVLQNEGPQPPLYRVGELIFHTANMHIFEADLPGIEYRASQGQTWIA